MTEAVYDRIGRGYARYRRPDPRIARRITEALGDAQSVVNVGAGTGSYEPADREVVALEPSAEMLRQRPGTSAHVVRGIAEQLPLRDHSVDAALAVLSMHHWRDWRQGVEEMRRVARDRVVILTWDPDHGGFWLSREFFPEIIDRDREIFPPFSELLTTFSTVDVQPIPIPHDCTDGFLGAYWRRPERYLEPAVRRAISAFSWLSNVEARLEKLRRELRSGAWTAEHHDILRCDELDLGYRLITGSDDRESGRS